MHRLSAEPQYEHGCNCCVVSLFSPWMIFFFAPGILFFFSPVHSSTLTCSLSVYLLSLDPLIATTHLVSFALCCFSLPLCLLSFSTFVPLSLIYLCYCVNRGASVCHQWWSHDTHAGEIERICFPPSEECAWN